MSRTEHNERVVSRIMGSPLSTFAEATFPRRFAGGIAGASDHGEVSGLRKVRRG
jgi:hypothetical protein